MRSLRKFLVLTLFLATLCSSSNHLQAEVACIDNGGCAYEEACRTSSLAPAIALGAIALIAIIAVAVQNTSGHSHCHSH